MSTIPHTTALLREAQWSKADHGPGLTRLGWLIGLFIAELVAVSIWVDGADLAGGPFAAIGSWGPWILRAIVAFAIAFLALATLRNGPALERTFTQAAHQPVHWSWLLGHFATLAVFAVASAALYGKLASPVAPSVLAAGWVLAGTLAIVCGVQALFPISLWAGLLREAGSSGLYAATIAVLACGAFRLSQTLWQPAAELTFQLVQIVLRPIIPNLTADPTRLLLRGNQFGVIINQECSGLEGAGLILVFGSVFLWLFRKELRFPRAFLLLPAGVVVLYGLNVARIAALLLIGDAGAREIAAGGFHSQAGWISFNAVAFGFAMVARRMRWFALEAATPATGAVVKRDATAAYLAPFLAILAAGMIATAVSDGFEWFYGLRPAACGILLWWFRREYRNVTWRFGGLAVAAGVGVLLLWIGFDWLLGIPASGMPDALASSGALLGGSWIALRIVGGVLMVPIAEELAFRGFLMRRISSASFEALDYRRTGWSAVLISSVLFGALHGERWFAGVLAGLVYALLVRKTGRLGDAIAAHSITNGLLAVLVLVNGQWQYW